MKFHPLNMQCTSWNFCLMVFHEITNTFKINEQINMKWASLIENEDIVDEKIKWNIPGF